MAGKYAKALLGGSSPQASQEKKGSKYGAALLRGERAGPLINEEFEKRIEGMDPVDISIARSKNDEFGDYLRAKPSLKTQDKPLDQPSTGESMARAALQGGTFGFGDEIVAAGAAALDPLVNETGGTFGDRYEAYRAKERRDVEKFRETDPVKAYGAEIAGAIPTAMLPMGQVGRLAQGGSLGARTIAGAGVGAAQGGAYGLGVGEGDPQQQAESAAQGALMGGAAGAAAPAIGYAAKKVIGGPIKNIANRITSGRNASAAKMPRAAHEIMQEVMQADDSLTGAGAARIKAAGPQAMLADAGPNATSLLDTAVQGSGKAATIARQAVDARVAGASKQIRSALDDALGAPKGLRETANNIAQSTSGARSDAYDAAYETFIDYGSKSGKKIEDTLGRVPSRLLKKAVDEANDEMVAFGGKNAQIAVDLAEDGSFKAFKTMPNVQQLDHIKRALQNIGYENLDQFGRPTSAARRAQKLAQDLRGALGEASPAYNQATKAGADKIAMDQALDIGRKALRPGTTREIIAEASKGMSPAEHDMAIQGIRTHLDESLSNVKMALTDRNVDIRESLKVLKELSSRANRDKVSALAGKSVAKELFKDLDQATAAFELKANVAANSRTFARGIASDRVKERVAEGPINALRSGEPLTAAKNLSQLLMGRTPAAQQKITDETYSALVEKLTGPRGNDALSLVELLQRQKLPGQALQDQTGTLAQTLMQRNAPITSKMIDGGR